MSLGGNATSGTEITEHRAVGGVGGLDMGSLQVAEGRAGADYGRPNTLQTGDGVGRPQPFGQQGLGFSSAQAGGGASGCCAACGGAGGQPGMGHGGGGGTARRGPDGAWLDEENRRLYTEAEVREAIEQEGRAWREKVTSLETSLSTMESEAKAALMRAQQANAALTEQLRAAEGKTYALKVHLAQTNRPSHLA